MLVFMAHMLYNFRFLYMKVFANPSIGFHFFVVGRPREIALVCPWQLFNRERADVPGI